MKHIALISSSRAEPIEAALTALGVEVFTSPSESADAIVFAADCSGDFSGVIRAFYKEMKPIGCFGSACLHVARAIGRHGITVTGESELAAEVAKTGALYEFCADDDFVTDREHRVISAPNFAEGIRKALAELVEMA